MIAGIVSLVFGLVLLLFPKYLKGLSAVVDRYLFVLDEYLRPYQKPAGFILLVVGGIMVIINLLYPALSLILAPVWVIAILFGLLFVAMPDRLKSITAVADAKVVDTDEYVQKSSRFVGIILLIAGLYMFVIAITYR